MSFLKKDKFEVNITFVSSNKMRALNKKYLNQNYATDVLAFNSEDFLHNKQRAKFFGDIIICPETAKKNCVTFGTVFEDEIRLYVIHGILHLAGFKDKTTEEQKLMRKKENELLQKISKNI
ncbi:protein belonging to Uncharacterized protein family UPF0054 [Candidatus Omnitrophus magneticus]|uniref:Endoribonuclease YbeY n=1 Tax=Candidatus Omnitrophus magneticus TaxID=1609969 RepID=A0A0F0CTH5_9BACT|nr:protein belonging to Uncharacterized protein family UPF0054 [Candidatus Omnitrophus magneticus]